MIRLRAAMVAALALGFAAGLLAATSLASAATGALLDTVTGTGSAPTLTDTTTAGTTTAETTTAATTTDTVPTTTTTPAPTVIADGVTIGGTDVGGMSPSDAKSAVAHDFARPLAIVAPGLRVSLRPAQVGASAAVGQAVASALKAPAGTEIPLPVRVESARVHTFVTGLAKRYDRRPVDSVLSLRHLKPFVSRGRPGRTLRPLPAQHAILVDLRQSRRAPVRLTGKAVAQKVSRTTIGPVIVIRNNTHTLTLYNGMRFVRRFGVATGQSRYPTPNGRFSIVVMWKNPWWYPPNDPWAAGEKPTPPGPGNPLGTRWMGLSYPGVGIHGTPEAGSIGYSLSHGCIRMRIPEAEWLFDHVRVGATVFIVPA